MTQHYSNPERESDPQALPDVEVFYHEHAKRELCMLNAGHKAELYGECATDEEGDCRGSGWYWRPDAEGVMPDSDPVGPFESGAEALADAQAGSEPSDDRSLWCSWCGTRPVSECVADPCSGRRMLRSLRDGAERLSSDEPDDDTDPDPLPPCAVCSEPKDAELHGTWNEHGEGEEEREHEYVNPDELPPCVQAMRCYCAGHARGNAASEPCDTSEQPSEGRTAMNGTPNVNAPNGSDPTTEDVYQALEEAIDAACDVDTRNDISREYRRIMRERGWVEGNEESEDES